MRKTLFIVFIAVFTVHFKSNVITSTDSKWVVPTALSIIKNHTTNLDEFHNLIVSTGYYAIDSPNHHYYCKYSIGTSLITIPFIYLIDKFYTHIKGVDIYNEEKNYTILKIELFIASIIVALTAVFIFLIAQLLLNNTPQSILVTFIFACCTSAWSTASRALWQHGPSMLVLSIVLYLILKAKNKPQLVIWLALPLAFSYVIRPSNFISVFFITLFVFINYRKYFVRYLLLALIIAIPFFAYNISTYGTLLTTYYVGQHQGHSSNYIASIFGNLFSPARGLFIFSPVLVFSVIGMWFKYKSGAFNSLDLFLILIIAAHLLLFSAVERWWAGWSFGPRYFTDIIPFFIYFLIGAFEWVNTKNLKQKMVFVTVLIPFIIISFYINYRGATHYSTFDWNATPNNIDEHTERLWQWNDLQFLR